MSSETDDPLLKAGRKYQEVHELAAKLANAAHHHPEAAFDKDQSWHLGDEFTDYEEISEYEAEQDMRILSYFLSEQWQDAQEYFMFDFEREFNQYLEEVGEYEDTNPEMEAFDDLNDKYDELEQELATIANAVEHVTGIDPAEKVDTGYKLSSPNWATAD